MTKSKLNNKPKKTPEITGDKAYIPAMLSSEKYIPLNLTTSAKINLRRVLELERFRTAHELTFSKLTKTEVKIMVLLSEGSDRKEIGEKLFISPNTVRTHRNNIYKKLEISRFPDLILYARAFDLI